MPIAYGGAGAILGASVGESDLKIVATFTGKLINNLIARPGIKTAKDLRNKTVGVQSIGGTNWIGTMLWLEHFGLDPSRDKISIQVIGDQTVRAQALEAGKIDAASVDTIFSKRLEQRGFTVLGDPHKVDIPFVGVDIVSPRSFIAEQPATVENVLKALLESLAYVVAPKNQAAVLDVIMKRLRVSDRGPAEEGYQDLVKKHVPETLSVRRGIAQYPKTDQATESENCRGQSRRSRRQPFREKIGREWLPGAAQCRLGPAVTRSLN